MTTLANEAVLEQAKTDQHGLYAATVILSKITDALEDITRQKRFDVSERTKMQRYPHLAKRIKDFQSYSEQLSPEQFNPTWWKQVGGMAIPWNRRNGNIHLYLLDNGLLSKSLPQVPDLNYEQRSTFFLNRVFGLKVSEQRTKGKIHLHVIDIADLDDFDNMAIKRAIAKEHESRGNFMQNSSMIAFSLRKHCLHGGEIKDRPDLAVNSPEWFARQIPRWRLG